MTSVSRSVSSERVDVAIHNEGASPVDVQVVLRDGGVVARTMTLKVGETGAISAPEGSPAEVHAPDGTATAPATDESLFVVRDGSVLVVAPA